MSERIPVEREVVGRPIVYARGGNEQRWKAAVRYAFAGATLPGPARIQGEADFVLAVQQRGRREPGLDNLMKTALDAFEGVLSERSCTGARVEVGDVLVDRIVASKRHVCDCEQPGCADLGLRAAQSPPLEPVRTCTMSLDSCRGKP